MRLGLILLILSVPCPTAYADSHKVISPPGDTEHQLASPGGARIKPAKILLRQNSENQLVANGITGSIQGEDTREYLFAANTGQQLQLELSSDHALVGFRITAPASTRPLYHSHGKESSYSVTIPRDGTYRIRVFLKNAAADKNERADFTMNIRISNPG
uniref:Gifsy-1 prophage protein precursor n=1 Tax=Microbulbifer agarilyticus TaxID=260552 RepID=UPI000255A48C|nr:Gifsy-1 prophage protein precursor [Microbulbifer agarilyticus]